MNQGVTEDFVDDVEQAIREISIQHGIKEEAIDLDNGDPTLITVRGKTEEGRVNLVTAVSSDIQQFLPAIEQISFFSEGVDISESHGRELESIFPIVCETSASTGADREDENGHIGPVSSEEELNRVAEKFLIDK